MGKVQKEIVRLWFDYQGAGTPLGNSFEGFINWLIDKEANESSHS